MAESERMTAWDPATGQAYFEKRDMPAVAEKLAKYEDLQPTPEKLAAELLAHEKRAVRLERELEVMDMKVEELTVKAARATAMDVRDWLEARGLSFTTAKEIAGMVNGLGIQEENFLREWEGGGQYAGE